MTGGHRNSELITRTERLMYNGTGPAAAERPGRPMAAGPVRQDRVGSVRVIRSESKCGSHQREAWAFEAREHRGSRRSAFVAFVALFVLVARQVLIAVAACEGFAAPCHFR